MKDLKHLPDAELEVMQAIWSLEPPVTAGSLPAAGEHQLYQAAVRRLGQEPGRQPVGRGRADRAGHRRPARVSGRAGTVG